jgi:hypothetical protein
MAADPAAVFLIPVPAMSPVIFTEQFKGRQLELIGVPTLADLPGALGERKAPFILFIATGTTTIPETALCGLCEQVLGLGAVYISCWGPQSSFLEACFDHAEAALHPEATSVVRTTSHENDSLEDAIWFVVHSAYPDDAYEDGWKHLVLCAVGSEDWRRRARVYLALGAPGPADF